MGSRLRRASIRLSLSARLPTVSPIFASRALRSSALARMALSTAGQYFSWSGVSCNAAFTRSTLISVSVFRSAAFSLSGVRRRGLRALRRLRVGNRGCSKEECGRSDHCYFQHLVTSLRECLQRQAKNGDALRSHVDLSQGSGGHPPPVRIVSWQNSGTWRRTFGYTAMRRDEDSAAAR